MPKKKGELSIEERLEQSIVAKEEEPYKLPSNWVWAKLGELGEYKKGPFGSSLTKSMFVPKGENTIKVYEQKNAIQKDWKLGNYYITEEYFKNNMTSFEVKEKDIIVSCAGTIGETYILPLGIEKGIINQALMRITLNKNIIEKYYLLYFDYILKKASNDLSNGSAIKNIPPFKIFKELGFALPPLEEQKRIVEKLDSLFEKIQKIKEIIEEVKEKTTLRREAILSKAFSGELTEKWRGENHTENARELLVKINDEKLKLWEDECKKAEDEGKKKPAKPKLKAIDEMLVGAEEEPYKLPNNWIWIKLGELGEYKKGPFGSSLTKSMFVPKGENTIKVYEQKNAIQKDWKLGNYYITEEYFKNNMTSFEVKEKDIIVSCAGTIGETYILPIGIEKGIINQALMRITLSKNISEKYYLFYFDYILKKASNDLSNGSAIKNIPPFKIFKELGFALPPLEEQKEIVRVLDKVFEEENRISELISLENKIEILEKTILDRAFRGELDTGNNDDEPAIELLRRCLEGKR